MAETTLVDGFKYPIKDENEDGCIKCHLDAAGGTYPIGLKNRSWHSGLHFQTDKPIVAIADGEVVAYRFSKKSLEVNIGSKQYSDSFVLLRHYYKSTFGNALDFYSLYMHLEPEPSGKNLPPFLSLKGYITKGKDMPAPGLMMYKSDDYKESVHLVPKYSFITLTGDPISEGSNTYQPASFVDVDGTTYSGVFKNAAPNIKNTEDGKTYIEKAPHQYFFGPSKAVWNCCKNLKGILVRSTARNNAEIVGFIPNGQLVEFEPISGNDSWGKLKSPLPNCMKNQSCFIKKHGQIAIDSSGQPDQTLLGALIIPEKEKRPQLQAGDVIGGPGQFILPIDKKIVHIEIFTLHDLSSEESIHGDPKGERFLSTIARYVIPAGQSLFPLPLESASLLINDTAKILEEPAGSAYVRLQITGLFRTVKYSWLNDFNPHEKVQCDELNIRTYQYKPKPTFFNEFEKLFNGWIEQTGIMYRVSTSSASRDVLFPCGTNDAARGWVEKSDIGEKDGADNVKIIRKIDAIYSQNPDSFTGQVTRQALTIDNPAIIKLSDKKYIKNDATTFVEITGIEPQTPFTWGGYELMCEDPANYDAFMDFANIKSRFIAGKGDVRDTETGKEFEAAIKVGPDKYDIRKVTADKIWKERLEKLIVRVPSEWHYSDEKYSTLTDKIGELSSDEVKKMIKSLGFWDDCKAKGVFDKTDISPEFSANATDGKEIWCFHPLAFLQQMSILLKAGLSVNQKVNFDAFMGLIRAATGDNYSDGESCKAIAASLSYRLKNYEWVDSSDFHSLAERHTLPVVPPTNEEFSSMIEHVQHIFLDRKWSGLPDGYVLYHASSESISSLPWDTSVLDMANAKIVGAFTFYKYKPGAKSHATILSIKGIKLVSGGDKGTSLLCASGDTLSIQQNADIKPYRYELKSAPRWNFEFQFNIQNCTPAMETVKSTLKWELQYFHKKDGKYEIVKIAVAHTENKFSLTIPSDVSDYSVTLVPNVGSGSALCNGFAIAIKKKEQLIFNGSILKWVDETGAIVPFQDGMNLVNEIPSFSGNTGKRSKEFVSVLNEGPIPEGVWWVKKSNLQSYASLGWWGKAFDTTWQGGEARWGKHRIWLEPENGTDTKGREKISICGGNVENGGGDIHLKDKNTIFVNNFVSRVEQGGRLMLNVDYTIRKIRILGRLSSQYETGGRGSITVSTGEGDAGGVSYGAYQMTSKPNGGNVTLFVQSSDFLWSSEFTGLTAGTSDFTIKWKDIVNAYKEEFVKIEHEYIKKTHYDPLVEKIKNDNDIDITEYSNTLNDVVWSTAVQHGKSTGIIGIAINNVKVPVSKSKEYDKELIKEIYAERGRKKDDDALVYFSKNSKQVQEGVSKRYESELQKALKELEDEIY